MEPSTATVWFDGKPLTMFTEVELVPRSEDVGPPIKTPTSVQAIFTFKMSRLTGRNLYRLVGITPPPLIHNGGKPRRKARKRAR